MILRHCSAQAGEGGRLCAWVAALPERVPLPAVTFSDEDLAACGDADTVREARAIRASLDASFVVRGPSGVCSTCAFTPDGTPPRSSGKAVDVHALARRFLACMIALCTCMFPLAGDWV